MRNLAWWLSLAALCCPLALHAQGVPQAEISVKKAAPPGVSPTSAADVKTAPEPPPAAPEINTIVLQGLNKVTGHTSRIEGPVGTVLRFGTLEIIAQRCVKSSPEESPENSALLDIRELTPGEGPKNIFFGWMFSSSPGLSGLEHPVYDITVLSCEGRQEGEK